MRRIVERTRSSSCACGRVRCQAVGAPIVSLVFAIATIARKAPVELKRCRMRQSFRDADGGTPLLAYRDDRFRCSSGEELLVGYKITERSPTRRMVASCCNSAMFLKYAPGFWVSAYRARFEGDDLPPLEMRDQIEHRRADSDPPRDVPCYRGFPMRLFAKIISARIAMLLGR